MDFTKPATTDNYLTAFVPGLIANQLSAAKYFDSATETFTAGLVTGVKRYNSTGLIFEKYNGSSWVEMPLAYFKSAGGTITGATIINAGGLSVTGGSLALSGGGALTVGVPSAGTAATVSAVALGGTIGNEAWMADMRGADANATGFILKNYRWGTGGAHGTSMTKLQRRVDSTDMGFIGFKSTGNADYITIGSGVTQYMNISDSGNVVVNAPGAGTPFTVNGGPSNNSILASMNLAGGIFSGLQITNTASTGYAAQFMSSNGIQKQFRVNSAGGYEIINNANTTAIYTLSDAGNITGTSSAGNGLSLTLATNNNAITSTDGTCSAALYLGGASGAIFGTTTNQQLQLYTNNASRVAISAAGNVTINAPSGGATLTAVGTSYFQGAAAAGTVMTVTPDPTSGGNGVAIAASFATGGYGPINFQTTATTRLSIAASGGVTLSAPTSGIGLTAQSGAVTTPVSLTFAASQTINTNLSNVFKLTLTGNITTLTLSNPSDGQTINLFVTQDATGSRTIAWPTGVKWPGGTAGVLSTAANSVDLVVLTYIAATGFWYAGLAKAFA
ncbi:MAG: beta strand repeat-containing protein [Leptothrix sp. (in: b-proteobacteria)]